MTKLINKTAIITGGESGIGQSIAAEFARNGADIIITYLNDEIAANNTLAIVKRTGRNEIIVR
jgi:glucose 1-dehydrogenase